MTLWKCKNTNRKHGMTRAYHFIDVVQAMYDTHTHTHIHTHINHPTQLRYNWYPFITGLNVL